MLKGFRRKRHNRRHLPIEKSDGDDGVHRGKKDVEFRQPAANPRPSTNKDYLLRYRTVSAG